MNDIIVMAGSCSLEPLEETMRQADFLHSLGINYIRAMLWKPRTTKNSFQGAGKEGLKILRAITEKHPNTTWVTEVMDPDHIDILENEPNLNFVYQIGARNCQNFSLLKRLGKLEGHTFNYKRGMSQTIDEYIGGADYLEPDKNQIWLCLRGIRTFDTSMRNTPDVGAILTLKDRFEYIDNKYKIIFDPSHATGKRNFVRKMANIAIIGGADGLEIEIHSNPDNAQSDADQTINFDEFAHCMRDIEMLKSFKKNN